MIPETSTVIEYLPGAPCVTERFTLMTQDAGQPLRRMLTRFGFSPFNVGFRIGGVARQEVILIMRRSDGGEVDNRHAHNRFRSHHLSGRNNCRLF